MELLEPLELFDELLDALSVLLDELPVSFEEERDSSAEDEELFCSKAGEQAYSPLDKVKISANSAMGIIFTFFIVFSLFLACAGTANRSLRVTKIPRQKAL